MNDLPRFVVVALAILIGALFALNIVADIFVPGYSGYPTTMLLAGLLGGVLGIDRWIRNSRNGGDR